MLFSVAINIKICYNIYINRRLPLHGNRQIRKSLLFIPDKNKRSDYKRRTNLKTKFFKKFVAAAALLALITLNFGGCFLLLGNNTTPTYAQREYIEPDREAITQSVEELTELTLKSGNETRILIKRSRLMQAFYQAMTSAVVAQIEYYKDVTNSENAERAAKIQTFLNEFQNSLLEAEKAIFSSQYGEYFTELTNNEYAATVLAYKTKTPELLALEATETELETEYSAQSVNPDPEKMAQIFTSLVKTRNAIARMNQKQNGEYYSNYHEYAYAEVYGRDYTPETAAAFRQSLADAFLPVRKDLLAKVESYTENLAIKAEDLMTYIPQIINDSAPDMIDSWNYMKKYGLYDFSAGENKMETSFVIEFPEYDDGFLFLYPYGNFNNDIDSVIHEFGHYNAIFKVDPKKDGSASMNYDLAETHSQCFELLTMPSVKKLLTSIGEESYYENYAYERMTSAVWAFLSNAAFDKFEYDVYNADETKLTRSFLESAFTAATNEYWPNYTLPNGKVVGMGYQYYEVPHLFSSPAYCISYSVSLTFASEIWAQQNNFAKYKEVVSYGKNHVLADVCYSTGLSYPLDQSSVTAALNAYKRFISANLGIQYDVSGGTTGDAGTGSF